MRAGEICPIKLIYNIILIVILTPWGWEPRTDGKGDEGLFNEQRNLHGALGHFTTVRYPSMVKSHGYAFKRWLDAYITFFFLIEVHSKCVYVKLEELWSETTHIHLFHDVFFLFFFPLET